MRISVMISEESAIKPGEQMPGEFVLGAEKPQQHYLLTQAEINPRGEEILLTGVNYVINDREYDLSSGSALVCALRNGIITPKLRDAKLNEKYAFQKATYARPHVPSRKFGKLNLYWPIVANAFSDTIESSTFVDKALDVISEEKEIAEDYSTAIV